MKSPERYRLHIFLVIKYRNFNFIEGAKTEQKKLGRGGYSVTVVGGSVRFYFAALPSILSIGPTFEINISVFEDTLLGRTGVKLLL